VRSLLYDGLTDDNANCAPDRWDALALQRLCHGLPGSAAYRLHDLARLPIVLHHDGLGYEELARLGALVFATTLSVQGGANRLLAVGSGTGSLVLLHASSDG
jgi:hypothetical protein